MNKNNKIKIEKELKKSYLNYAMSVIVGRALPDVRDGLKPVHRRILYAMFVLKNYFNKPYKKSARIVGDVIGKYHPHGDNAVYDSIVRMAQNFSLRYPLIEGQGNFGSIDGDSAAAMRYTEIRMSEISQELLKDIDKNTIKFIKNYDETQKMPEILPATIPNILINGSTGIAVGMATNIPPHNIKEIINATIIFLYNKKITTKNLMKYVKGPDFPTGGIIENIKGIYNAYKTGKGTIKIKSKIEKENNKKYNKKYIIIKELPYQINKTKIIENIIELVKEKKINEISNIRDESNKDGIRIVIETKKGSNRKITINKLYCLTNLQTSYGINIVALYKGKPQTLSLKKILYIFIKYRKKIIKKKTIFELKKNKKKLHIYKGFIITLINIDKIISLIKKSNNINNIKLKLLKKKWIFKKKIYYLSEKQINSILNLSLIKLTKIEQNKINIKYNKIKKNIYKLKKILNNKKILKNIIKKELINIKNKFGDNRLTKIKIKEKKINIKDLIKKENIIIILTKLNYINYKIIENYEIQHKGGKGKNIKIKNNNYDIKKFLIINTHENFLLFSNKGKCFKIKTYNLLIYKNKKFIHKPIIKFINIKNEKITFILKEKNIKKYSYIIIITKNGMIKKINTKKIIIKNKRGLNIIKLKKNDYITSANYINKNQEIMIFTKFGKSIRFHEKNVRQTNRNSSGVKAIKLNKKDKIVSSLIINNNKKDEEIMIITQNGYGKRTFIKEFLQKSRATKGIISIKINNKNKYLVKAIKINKNNKIAILTNKGTLIYIKIKEINILKRNTQGIILMRINKNKDEKIIDIQKLPKKLI